jgi:hypothetical protein
MIEVVLNISTISSFSQEPKLISKDSKKPKNVCLFFLLQICVLFLSNLQFYKVLTLYTPLHLEYWALVARVDMRAPIMIFLYHVLSLRSFVHFGSRPLGLISLYLRLIDLLDGGSRLHWSPHSLKQPVSTKDYGYNDPIRTRLM